MKPRFLFPLAGLALAGFVLYLLWLWQPERQVLRHQRTLIGAVGDRNWKKVGRLMSADYHDRWGFTVATGPEMASEVFRNFFTLAIKADPAGVSVSDHTATVFARLALDGNGTFIAQEVVVRVNRLKKPFRFEWKRESRWPWDWKLMRVDQQELQILETTGIL